MTKKLKTQQNIRLISFKILDTSKFSDTPSGDMEIVGFSIAKKHLAISLEIAVINHFSFNPI